MDKEKKDDTFLRKKKSKQNIATTMESVDGKGTVFPMDEVEIVRGII